MHESFDDYVIALRDLVKTCNYCTAMTHVSTKALRDQIIEGLRDGDTVEELLRQKQLTIETTPRIGRAHESARQQREEIKSNPTNSANNATHTKRNSHMQTHGEGHVTSHVVKYMIENHARVGAAAKLSTEFGAAAKLSTEF